MRSKNEVATVVLIDEEKRSVLVYYEDAIRSRGFELKRCYSVESALETVRQEKPDLIVMDVMMPPGTQYSEAETMHGLLTGVLLHRDLQASAPGVPIIVLTNCRESAVLSALANKPLTKVLGKTDCPPFALAEEVAAMLIPTREI